MKPITQQGAAHADDAVAARLPQSQPDTDARVAEKRATPSERWTMASLSLTMLLASLGTSIANVGLPTLAQAFDAPFQQVQWVVLAYLLTITTLVVSVGRIGDLVGRRRLMLIGIGLFTLASVLCAISPTLWTLIVARAIQGLGAAIMMALAMALVGETVPKARTGSAMGLLGTMSAVGTAAGPLVGGTLIAGFGWPSIFWLSLPLGALAFLLVQRNVAVDPPVTSTGGARLDKAGSLLLALTLAAYALAMTMGRGQFGSLNAVLLLSALIGLSLFIRVESRAVAPLIRLSLFRGPALRSGFAANVLVMTVMMATLVVGPFYLAHALALDAARVGLAMSFGPIVAALAGVPAGRVIDRLGADRMSIVGLGAMLVGSCLLFLLPSSLGVPGYIVPLGIVTAGFALFQTANNTGVMADVRADQRGVVSGLLTLSRNLGLITGASAMGAVFALGSGFAGIATAARPAAAVAGMRLTFIVAAGLVFLAAIVVTMSRRTTLKAHAAATSA